LSETFAGDIVAAIGMRESITGDTLCETQHPILLEHISFAEAVVSKSIEPESSADKQKLTDTLNLLKKEDRPSRGASTPKRADPYERHGRSPPGDQAAPDGTRLSAPGPRRQASG